MPKDSKSIKKAKKLLNMRIEEEEETRDNFE